jgi:hypothetical protein
MESQPRYQDQRSIKESDMSLPAIDAKGHGEL